MANTFPGGIHPPASKKSTESKRIEEAYLWYWKRFGILRTDKVVQPSGDDGFQFARLDKGLDRTLSILAEVQVMADDELLGGDSDVRRSGARGIDQGVTSAVND